MLPSSAPTTSPTAQLAGGSLSLHNGCNLPTGLLIAAVFPTLAQGCFSFFFHPTSTNNQQLDKMKYQVQNQQKEKQI
jgi:hypothetical protein